MQFPKNREEWLRIAKDFEDKWNFPNCLGSVDGKHVMIVPPSGSGSYFYNYKGFHSLVLMAIVNANYEFVMCDFGINGGISDGGVLHHTAFHDKLVKNELSLPPPCPPKNSQTPLPFVFIGDEAFSLRKEFLKPFSRKNLTNDTRIFNYRLSRARRVVENAFGILASRFRIFHLPINMKLENIDSVVMASCVLHNFLRRKQLSHHEDITTSCGYEENAEVSDSVFRNLDRGHNRRSSEEAKQVRLAYVKYFTGDGAISWQENHI